MQSSSCFTLLVQDASPLELKMILEVISVSILCWSRRSLHQGALIGRVFGTYCLQDWALSSMHLDAFKTGHGGLEFQQPMHTKISKDFRMRRAFLQWKGESFHGPENSGAGMTSCSGTAVLFMYSPLVWHVFNFDTHAL